jgi:hypothetical protein
MIWIIPLSAVAPDPRLNAGMKFGTADVAERIVIDPPLMISSPLDTAPEVTDVMVSTPYATFWSPKTLYVGEKDTAMMALLLEN